MTLLADVTWLDVWRAVMVVLYLVLIAICVEKITKTLFTPFNKIDGPFRPPYTVKLCRGIAFPEVILNRTLFNRCAHHPPFRWFHLVRFTVCKCVDNSRALTWRLWIYTRRHAIHLDANWKRGGF